MDNKLFEVEPRKGKLHPGENVTVTFTYRHLMAGTDRLPVLFKIENGREILVVNLTLTVYLFYICDDLFYTRKTIEILINVCSQISWANTPSNK